MKARSKTSPAAGAPRCVVVEPASAEHIETHAAAELAKYLRAITGVSPAVVTDQKVLAATGGTRFLIGLPSRNKVSAALAEEGRFPDLAKLPAHDDSFATLSSVDKRSPTVLLGGRRAVGTLYAVYAYLSQACGVGFFQDGEFVPSLPEAPGAMPRAIHSPRFDNRMHLCWNAHRGMRKYHAFFWTLEDWKRELRWMTKQRLNTLRLDMMYYSRFAGDCFEQAFPEIGPEPPDRLYPRMGGWPVDWDWPPAYRRELTQRIFEYGRSIGIRFLYTLDFAVVPFRFRTVHPELEYLPGNQYGESREVSPDDPFAREIARRYLAKCVELFGTDHLYFINPYAELDVGAGSVQENARLRIEAGRQIVQTIRQVDPKGILFNDSWDMAQGNRWNEQVVKSYLDSFDAEGFYFNDLAADIYETPLYKKYNCWHGKEWSFGILHSFAGSDELHGNAEDLIGRIQQASECPTCTGVFLAPELTHHNPMYWDLACQLAWQPSGVELEPFLAEFLSRRYGRQCQGTMLRAWRKIVEAVYRSTQLLAGGLSYYPQLNWPLYQWMDGGFSGVAAAPLYDGREDLLERIMQESGRQAPLLREALGIMLSCAEAQAGNALYTEDVVAVFRSLAHKCFNLDTGRAYQAFKQGDLAAFSRHRDRALAGLQSVEEVLAKCRSYWLSGTIRGACRVPGHNVLLPELIRQACINGSYVTNDAYELVVGYYRPQVQAYFELLEHKLRKGARAVDMQELRAQFDGIADHWRRKGFVGRPRQGDPLPVVAKSFRTVLS